ncbi:MAG TPA: glycosyltransferase family 4 protein [Pyrinomonadaceae bacterium]|nr:glycosyltransferase family 4 protein [Pyrinomonadaceae bacterium]
MNRVAVLTSHLSKGDAVSNDVAGMCAAFQRRGYEARMFAGGSDLTEPEIGHVAKVKEFLTSPKDLLVYHFSIGWKPGLELLREVKCRRAIKYHNVTPPEFFANVSLWHEKQCRAGREEIEDIARAGCDIYLSDSDYNRGDLLRMGVPQEKCFVVAPFHHIERLQLIEPDMDVLDEYRDGYTNVLMVGRIAPNKGHQALIEAFAAYHYDYNRKSRLLIVGKEAATFKAYSKRLREFMTYILAGDIVTFTGEVSESALKSYYLLSNVFAMTSEHEGFCVPVLEAMSMKLPVVAYASSAIPEMLEGAGIVLKERSPYLMAEAIDRLTRDESAGYALGTTGRQRYERDFTNERIEAELFHALKNLDRH